MLRFLLILFSLVPYTLQADQQTGIELDALPWLTGGHYVSAWYATDHFKYRAVAAKINVPQQFVENGFKDKEITAYALIVDYFPDQQRQGIWYGAGLEYWQSSITNKQDQGKAEYDNTVATVGLGYVWQLTDSIYLNPWAALHVIVNGENEIQVGNQTYQQDEVTPSASLKLGVTF